MNVKTLLNGVACDSSLKNDRALHFGDGLFETIAVINGDPCLWDRHFLRLEKGCERIGISIEDNSIFLKEALMLCNDIKRGVLKVIVSAGEVTRGYMRASESSSTRLLSIKSWPTSPEYLNCDPINLGLCKTRLGTQPILAGIKHLNRLEQVLARASLDKEYFEGVMLDQQGNVIEGIMSNLLINTERGYVTPSITHCGVEGVLRGLMLDVATKNNITMKIEKVSLTQLREAKQLYIMNSLLGVRAVSLFQEQTYSHADEMPSWLEKVNQTAFQTMAGSL